MGPMSDVRRVIVIGAGPAGLVAARYLKGEECFDEIIIFEQRSTVGGIWNYETTSKSNGAAYQADTNSKSASFSTPMYRDLETNIVSDLMHFSDLPLDSDQPLFPGRGAILEYLSHYAEELLPNVRFEHQVVGVRHGGSAWTVKAKDLKSGEMFEESCEAIVVAPGHQSLPHYPELKGLGDWIAKYPADISHSFDYNGPDEFIGKTTLVIGNSVSGLDISHRLADSPNPPADPLYVSQRSKSTYYTTPPSIIKEVPATVSLDPERRCALFADGSEVLDIEKIILCTGFLYSFPFLGEISPTLPSGASKSNGHLNMPWMNWTSTPADAGHRTYNLYEYMFPFGSLQAADGHQACPTGLAFPGLIDKLVPFQKLELQAAVIAGVFSGRLSLPSTSEMQEWEMKELESKGNNTAAYNTLRYPKDIEYFDRLHDWALGKRQATIEKTTSKGTNKIPPRWNGKQRWVRTQIPKLRDAYMKQGNDRHSIKTVEQLGFVYLERESGI